MQVILLAAGQSTRLSPIADKNTLEFCGRPLIELQVAAVKAAKLRDIVVVANKFNMEKVKEALKKYNNIIVVEQKKLEDGMAGGVLAGAEKVSHKNILVMSANDVFEPALFEKIIEASKKTVDGVIPGKKPESYFPGGYLKLDKHDFITEVVEKPGAGKEPSKYVNLVCHVYNNFPAFAGYLKKAKSKKDDRYEMALSEYIKKGKAKMALLKYHGYWQPIKYPWDVLALMSFYMGKQQAKIDKSAKIAKSAHIKGDVYIGPNTQVFENAVIHGPAYIAEGCVIATNALVRESMLGKNCVIGFSTEVARSYLNHDVWTHSNYVGDSIIDHNVSFGSGTVLGNLRFDEGIVKMNIKKDRLESGTNKLGALIGSGTRIGINASTNPGVKIGKNCFIGGGMYIDKDIPDNKMVLLENKWKVMENKVNIEAANRQKFKKGLK
ncbi:NTP transferase domain-containing protein [Candidatus Peregrinibacteria bacterium]|nr:NTP transferase domain-containing protein [Candidatus Peregrinibacteria bacterium]